MLWWRKGGSARMNIRFLRMGRLRDFHVRSITSTFWWPEHFTSAVIAHSQSHSLWRKGAKNASMNLNKISGNLCCCGREVIKHLLKVARPLREQSAVPWHSAMCDQQ